MAINWTKRANPQVQDLIPYRSGKSHDAVGRELGVGEPIKLASNENPRGPGPAVLEAIREHLDSLRLYPDQHDLVQALSRKLSVPPECITLGNGSNDVLDLLARVFLAPGRSAIVSQYCFLVYPLVVALTGGELIEVPANQYGHDLKEIRAAIKNTTSMIYIANPNNPTGTWSGLQALEELLSQIPEDVVVVLDEAYFEYVQHDDYPNGLALLQKHENLVVTRTFSKVYGLASARIGYAVSNPEIADLLNRARQPFNANGMAMVAAMAALNDGSFVDSSVKMNRAGLAQLVSGLTRLQVPFIPSAGNFISFDAGMLPGVRVSALYQALLHEGVIVRPLDNYDMPNHMRATVGLPEENARFLQMLTSCLDAAMRRQED